MLDGMSRPLDETDLRLLATQRAVPHASVTEIAATVGIARGTVYSRIDRLREEGVVTGYGPDVDAVRAGLGVLAHELHQALIVHVLGYKVIGSHKDRWSIVALTLGDVQSLGQAEVDL